MKTTIVTCEPDSTKIVWLPTTLDQIGKKEQYLESVIAETPELLSLETRKTGIYGPYAVFRQLTFTTPQSRQIIPDILIVTASGNIIVVEVKLFANPELRDRRVIAQAIDYAASLSVLSDKELAQLFSQGKTNSWMQLVNSLFPDDEDPEELSATILSYPMSRLEIFMCSSPATRPLPVYMSWLKVLHLNHTSVFLWRCWRFLLFYQKTGC